MIVFLCSWIGCCFGADRSEEFIIQEDLVSFFNKNSIVEDACGEKWVLRTSGEVAGVVSDRVQEENVLRWARKEGLSLIEVEKCDASTGYLLTRFLPGRSTVAIDFQNEMLLQKALLLLYRLHTSEKTPIVSTFQPFAQFLATRDVAAKYGLSLPWEVFLLQKKLEAIVQAVPSHVFSVVSCHGDPSPGNFFYQDGELYLHDWELAERNDPMWDIAHFSLLANVDPKKIWDLYPTNDPLAEDKVVFFTPFVLFNTVVWASLERKINRSALPKHVVEDLYTTFLEKIEKHINSKTFQVSFQRMIEGGSL